MTNWNNYFRFQGYPWLDDMHHEILADTHYRLGINTLLFGILVKHIDDDYIPFCIEDFNEMMVEFYNTGLSLVQVLLQTMTFLIF